MTETDHTALDLTEAIEAGNDAWAVEAVRRRGDAMSAEEITVVVVRAAAPIIERAVRADLETGP